MLIETDGKLVNDVILKNAVLFTCVIKDDNKFYQQIILEESLVAQKIVSIGKLRELCNLNLI